jgi:hypothetical protein
MIDQPTARQLNASSTSARFTSSSFVGCPVMSVTTADSDARE